VLTGTQWKMTGMRTLCRDLCNNSSAFAEMHNRLVTIDMGRKVGVLCPFSWGGTGYPSNTISPGPRPTYVPSGILIHPTVWPQYTN